jgi:hypothetical protein
MTILKYLYLLGFDVFKSGNLTRQASLLITFLSVITQVFEVNFKIYGI